MTDNEKLEELIKEYSRKLMEAVPKEQLQQMQIPPTENAVETKSEVHQEETQTSEEMQRDEQTPSAPEQEEKTVDEKGEEENMLPEEEIIPEVETDPENFAYFVARIFAANGAFAVQNAKIVIYKGDVLHAFLITNENGETKRIKLASYPEINSFEPQSKDQRLDYSADVYAEGFTAQKDLLVSAVGGSDIVLNVALVPESEGIN